MGPSPFQGGHSWAAQPQGAGSARACLLGTAAAPPASLLPPWGPPPSLLNTTPHAYLALPWDSAWQEQGPPHAPHLSHPPCRPRDAARTKDCTHWALGDTLLSGGPAALSRSPCQGSMLVPVPYRVPLCLSH